MAQCKLTASDFIKNTFNPHVAVLCSPDAEVLCQKNNLTFVELVQPFCRLNTEGDYVNNLTSLTYLYLFYRISTKNCGNEIQLFFASMTNIALTTINKQIYV